MIIDGEFERLAEDEPKIAGNFGGGGSAAAGHVPVEANDTLASKQTLSMLFAIWDGEGQSIDEVYVNGTPASSYDCTVYKRLGTLDQAVIPGFTDVETPFSVATALVTNTPIPRSVSSSVVDAVRITLKLNALVQQLSNGDKVGYAVQISVQTRPVAGTGTWTTVGTITKSGKASSVYAWDTRINKPAGTTSAWEFRLTRITPADTSKQSSLVTFDSYTEIQDKALSYPGTGVVGIIFHNADQLGGRIPTISFDGHGLLLKVPAASFYNPATRTYTGTPWNGAFASAYQYCNSPPWVLFNVLTTALDFVYASKTFRRGLGIPQSRIDIFSFFEEAKYADALLSDGKGGQVHRFSINNQFYVRENAPTFLAYLLTIMNANLVIQNGLITLIIDRPLPVTKLVSNSNVINGEFSYHGTHLDERYTWVNVTFNDPDDKNNTKTISEPSEDYRPIWEAALGFDPVERYGFNPIDIVLVGCTSEAQARRKGRWVLEAPTGLVTFKRGFDGSYYNVGEVVNIYDTRYTQVDGQGYVVASTVNSITLDHPIEFGAGPYSIMVYGDDGATILEKLINQVNTTTATVTPATPFATVPIVNGPFIIKGEVIPRPFKIAKIKREDDQTPTYEVLATFYDAGKWDRIEGTVTVTPPTGVFSNVGEFTTEDVTNIQFAEQFLNDGIVSKAKLLVTWDWDTDNSEKFLPTFDVLWRRDNLPYTLLPSRQVKEAEILDAIPGVYDVIIYAVNIRGIRSHGVPQSYNYRIGATASTLLAPTDFWVKDTTDVIYNASHLDVTWTYNTANGLVSDVLKDYVVEIWTSDGTTKKATYIVNYDLATKGGEFNYSLQQNTADFGTPTRLVQIKLYSRDVAGDVSTPVAKTFNNPVPDAPSFSLSSGAGVTYYDLISAIPSDYVGGVIHRSLTSGFTPNSGNLLYDGPDTYGSFEAAQNTQYYYRVALYDTFGKTGLAYSSEISTTTLSFDPTNWAKTGLVFSYNSPVANSVSWTSGTILKNSSASFTVSAGNAAWTTGKLYIYFDPAVSTTTLQTTTSLSVAVGTGRWPIATYEGGTVLKGGDGSAFFSGSQLIAGSVGATELTVANAVITNSVQLANAIVLNQHVVNDTIDFAKITNTIQSASWSTTLHTGWKIDKTGAIVSYGSFQLYNNANQLMMDANGMDGVYIKNLSVKTAALDTASVTTLKVAGQAFSFKVLIEDTTIGTPVAVNNYAIMGTFSVAIEYVSEVQLEASLYITRVVGTTIWTEIYFVEYTILRVFDNTVVASYIVGEYTVTTLATQQPPLRVLQAYTAAPGSGTTLTDINQRCPFPNMTIQGTGDLTVRQYQLRVRLIPKAGTQNGGRPVANVRGGNYRLSVGVLKR